MAPNFFLEAKGPDGSAAVATSQARYDGALGARGMHSLQNYGTEEPTYDGKAYTYSSTYHNTLLQMYAHHVTAPAAPGGRPEYHMTQVKTVAMTEDRDAFVQGATAFRNLRDLAKTHRDNFIQAANARLPNATMPPPDEDALTGTTEALPQDSSPEVFVDCEEYHAPSPTGGDYILDADSGTAASFGHDRSRKRSRRPRNSPSSSQENGAAKKRVRQPAPASGSEQAGTESVWVETYWRKEMVCFKGLRNREVKTEWGDWVEHTLEEGTRCFYWLHPKSAQAFWTMDLPRS